MKIKNILLMSISLMGGFFSVDGQKVFAASCVSPEICTTVPYVASTNTFTEPSGLACESRGACPSSPSFQVCCKPDSSVTAPKSVAVGSGAKTTGATTESPTAFTNPLTFTSVEKLLTGILSAIQKIIVVLALVFMMIGSVMILSSAGNSGMVEQGKKAITMALVGFAFGVAAPSLLKQLSIIIGWGDGAAGPGFTLTEIALRVLNFLLGAMGIVALVMMVIGAIMYLTSAGDEDRIDKGKDIFKYSLIGVFMAMASMVLLTQIAKFFQ